MATSADAADRAIAIAQADIPADAVEALEIYAQLLRRWQKTINLVAPKSLPNLWTRHIADSWQVVSAAPDALTWVDLGSGAGFPGVVTAVRLAKVAGAHVHLIESDQRKCAFLRDVSRETGAPVTIHCGRIEAVLPTLTGIEAVSARALAPLDQLLAYAAPLLEKGAIGVFLKGEQAAVELTDSERARKYQVSLLPSSTAPASRLVIVRAADVPSLQSRHET